MTDNKSRPIGLLGLVTGFGNLSEEVIRLAAEKQTAGGLPDGSVRFVIEPWIPLVGNVHRIFFDQTVRSGKAKHINPFRFADIERQLVATGVKSVFLVGDLPRTRSIQVSVNQALGLALSNVADMRCNSGIEAAPKELSLPAKYFFALQTLLAELEIEPRRSAEIFSELNLSVGKCTEEEIDRSVIDSLPGIIDQMLRLTSERDDGRLRPTQAVIVSGGAIRAHETSGTNNMLKDYARRREARINATLVKLPTAEFDPVFDEPTVGPSTIKWCKRAGISGIILCAETSRIAQKSLMLHEAAGKIAIYTIPFSLLRGHLLEYRPNSWAANVPKAFALQ